MILTADIPGERLDAFLARCAEGLTRSAAQKLIEEGSVKRNGRPGKKNDKVAPGDIIEVEITCKQDEDGTVNMQGGVMDEEVFRRGYDILSASTLELTHFSNTKVEGTIDCNRDGLLYTSIPHDGNWSVEVDGKPAEFVLVGKCMISVELTEGSHTVSFSYNNKAFTTGLIVSISSALVFAGIIVLTQLFPRKKGKYEKVTD